MPATTPPFVDVSHNTGRSPVYVSLRAAWECTPSKGVQLSVAKVSSPVKEAQVLLSNDMLVPATVVDGDVVVDVSDDLLEELYARKSTQHLGADPEGMHAFVVEYAVILNENIELMGPLSVDHRCHMDAKGQTELSANEQTGLFRADLYRDDSLYTYAAATTLDLEPYGDDELSLA